MYIVLFALLMGGAIGLPIPEDVPLILAGILAHQGNGKTWMIFAVCYAAILLGDVFIFGVGRKLGPTLFRKKWFQSRVSAARIVQIRQSLERRSLPMIFVARHLFYLRTVTFLSCGAFHMSLKRFLLSDALAALVSVPLMMYLGFLASENYDAVMLEVRRAKNFTVVVGSIALLALALYLFRKYKRAAAETTLTNDALEQINTEPIDPE